MNERSSRKAFYQASHPKASWRQEAKPSPRDLAERGIKTRESLDWQAARHPAPPKLTFEHGNAFVRAAASEAARAEQRARINKLREDFRAKPMKARGDFGMARDYRGQDRER